MALANKAISWSGPNDDSGGYWARGRGCIFIWLLPTFLIPDCDERINFWSDHSLQAPGRAERAVATQSSFQFFYSIHIESKNIPYPIPTATMPHQLLSAFASAITLHSLSVSTIVLFCIQRYCTVFYTLKHHVYLLRRSIERGLTQPRLKGKRKTYKNAVSKRRKLLRRRKWI